MIFISNIYFVTFYTNSILPNTKLENYSTSEDYVVCYSSLFINYLYGENRSCVNIAFS